jgi:hypothetical protein
LAKTISAAGIVDLFAEAIETDKKLPSAYRKGASAMQFDIVHDASDHAAWKKREPKIVASAKKLKMHRHTVKEKYLETVIFIKYLIAYDKKLLDMIDKIT